MMYVYYNPVSRDIIRVSPQTDTLKYPYFISVDYDLLEKIITGQKKLTSFTVGDADDGSLCLLEKKNIFSKFRNTKNAKFDATEYSLSSFYTWDEYLNPFKKVDKLSDVPEASLSILIANGKARLSASKRTTPMLKGYGYKMKIFIADKNNFNILYGTEILKVEELAKKQFVEFNFNYKNLENLIIFTNTNFRSQVYAIENT